MAVIFATTVAVAVAAAVAVAVLSRCAVAAAGQQRRAGQAMNSVSIYDTRKFLGGS